MEADWTGYCRSHDLAVREPDVEVAVRHRKHIVTVEDGGDVYHLSAIVVRQAVVNSVPDLPLNVWLRNRGTTLVGFRIDQRGRLVGEAWVPKVGLTSEEFQLYLRNLAAECDRLEHVLTGRDVE